jgi:hypothetical protein
VATERAGLGEAAYPDLGRPVRVSWTWLVNVVGNVVAGGHQEGEGEGEVVEGKSWTNERRNGQNEARGVHMSTWVSICPNTAFGSPTRPYSTTTRLSEQANLLFSDSQSKEERKAAIKGSSLFNIETNTSIHLHAVCFSANVTLFILSMRYGI